MNHALDDARRLSRAQFVSLYRCRFLVLEDFKVELPAGDSSWDLNTRELDLVRRSPPERVFAIRKRQALYSEMITVGRTANHDIVVSDPRISKFHADFRLQPD